jgi:hypothetical protein
MRLKHVLAMMLAFLMIVGCGPRGIRYTATINNLECSGKRSVAVAILDERPYILNRERDPNYVGIMRGGYGNPFVTRTESGEPLADDMLATLSESLRSRGFSVIQLKTSTTDSQASIMKRFSTSGADRLILMQMKEWQSDYLPKGFANERSHLFIDLKFNVFDRNRVSLARKQLREEITLPSGWPENTVPDVYQGKLRRLLNDSRICGALR